MAKLRHDIYPMLTPMQNQHGLLLDCPGADQKHRDTAYLAWWAFISRVTANQIARQGKP